MPTQHDHLTTGRLVLRRWQDSDRDPFAALNADPEVMRYFPAAMDREGSDAFVDRIERRFESQGFGLWALELAETGQFLGYTGLAPMPEGVPGAGGMAELNTPTRLLTVVAARTGRRAGVLAATSGKE